MAREQSPREKANDKSLLNRRGYLKAAGASLAAAAAATTPAAAAGEERHGFQFNNVVNAVEDAGCDPSGEQANDSQIQQAAGNDTLLVFPEGTYKITDGLSFSNLTNFGMVGEGDVTFKVPRNYLANIILFQGGENFLLENIDIDQTADGSDAHMKIVSDGDFRVQDVTVHGYTPTRGQDSFRIVPVVSDPNSEAVIKNFTATDGAEPGVYKNGSGGLWTGPSNKGTIRIVDCHIEGFSNNGVYMGRSGGPVQVTGGTFKNNDVSQLRLSGENSFIEGANLIVDDPGDQRNTRCVWWDGAKIDKTGGEIRDCNIHIKSTPNSAGAIRVWATAGALTVKNSTIRVDEDGIPAVAAEPPNGGPFSPPPRPHNIVLENVHIHGDASGSTAVSINNRPESVISGCCIQGGSGRNGIKLSNSNGSVVRDTKINVGGQAVNLQGTSADTSNILKGESCDGTSHGTSTGDSGSESSSSDDSSSDDSGSSSESDGDSGGIDLGNF